MICRCPSVTTTQIVQRLGPPLWRLCSLCLVAISNGAVGVTLPSTLTLSVSQETTCDSRLPEELLPCHSPRLASCEQLFFPCWRLFNRLGLLRPPRRPRHFHVCACSSQVWKPAAGHSRQRQLTKSSVAAFHPTKGVLCQGKVVEPSESSARREMSLRPGWNSCCTWFCWVWLDGTLWFGFCLSEVTVETLVYLWKIFGPRAKYCFAAVVSLV